MLIEMLMASGLDILELARPRGFEPLTSASGGKSSSNNLNICNALVSNIYTCACSDITYVCVFMEFYAIRFHWLIVA